MHNVHEIAHASDRLSSIIFGPGDYSAAMGTPGLDIGQFPEYPGHYWHHALSECNAAAKSAGLPCLDGPYADIEDPEGFRESAENANMIGCDGKWAIHPSQIEIGNEVFAPDPETAERAKRIVDAYAEAMAEGKGAVSVDGQMVDEATNKMAQEIVAKADAAGRPQSYIPAAADGRPAGRTRCGNRGASLDVLPRRGVRTSRVGRSRRTTSVRSRTHLDVPSGRCPLRADRQSVRAGSGRGDGGVVGHPGTTHGGGGGWRPATRRGRGDAVRVRQDQR
jgi:hypothetical protein